MREEVCYCARPAAVFLAAAMLAGKSKRVIPKPSMDGGHAGQRRRRRKSRSRRRLRPVRRQRRLCHQIADEADNEHQDARAEEALQTGFLELAFTHDASRSCSAPRQAALAKLP